MAPTFLIVGATGNTGQSTVKILSSLIQSSGTFCGYRILALTRSSDSAVAQRLAKLPGVEVKEQKWSEITEEWLLEQNVFRAFIASHNEPNQFAEESTFHLAALNAGVKYVVRISTTAANVRPDCKAYYPRQHWAIEAMLGSPEFKGLQWTSLQPNVFSTFYLGNAAEFIKQYRKNGEQDTLRLFASEDAPVGIIHPDDVGAFAARLLVEEDTSKYNNAKYVMNGPENISGHQIVKLVEEYIGVPVSDVSFEDVTFIEYMAAATKESKNVISSIKYAGVTAWEGKCTCSTTSKQVLELAAPVYTPRDALKTLLEE